jgi:hypothetical protein
VGCDELRHQLGDRARVDRRPEPGGEDVVPTEPVRSHDEPFDDLLSPVLAEDLDGTDVDADRSPPAGLGAALDPFTCDHRG